MVGFYWMLSSILTLVGSSCVLIPSTWKTIKSNTDEVSTTYIVSKAVQLALQANYAGVLCVDDNTRQASYVLFIGIAIQTISLCLISCHKKTRNVYEELRDPIQIYQSEC